MLFRSTKDTLCRFENSALTAMLNGKYCFKIHKGRIFIDRDGNVFSMLLSYLRNNKIPLFENKSQESLFYEELNYWKIPYEIPISSFMQFDHQWCASSLRLELGGVIVRKHNASHGTIFCNNYFSSKHPYIELKLTINGHIQPPKSAIFLGVVDRIKYKP